VKILLISESKFEWEIFEKEINAQFNDIELVCVDTVEEALNAAASDGPFGFFVLDAGLTSADANALGLNLLEFTGSRPILFFGQKHVIDENISQELFSSNEHNESIYKPFDREDFAEDLKEKVESTLEWAQDQEYEQGVTEVDPLDYIPMKLRAFYLYDLFPYDIYLAITSANYIKIISANKPYSISTLTTYAKKNVKYLHIRKDERLAYLENESAKCIDSLKTVSPKDKEVYLLQIRSITILHQYVLALGVTDTVFNLVKHLVTSVINVFTVKAGLKVVLKEYPHFYEGIASKSLLTAYIASALGKRLEWESETSKTKLIVSSLLQDITVPEEGMNKIKSASSPKLKDFSEDNVQEFIQHPVAAAQFAKQFTMYPDLDYIIKNRHETPNRKGFPNRPSSLNLTQICAVLHLSQYLAAEFDGESYDAQKLTKVLKVISREFRIGVYRDTLGELKSLLKVR